MNAAFEFLSTCSIKQVLLTETSLIHDLIVSVLYLHEQTIYSQIPFSIPIDTLDTEIKNNHIPVLIINFNPMTLLV